MRIAAHVDPSRPDAWRQQPYYALLKRWAVEAAAEMHQVVVQIRNRAIVILPDQDVDLGPIGEAERIVTREVMTPLGLRLEALKMHKDDPRLGGLSDSKIIRPRTQV